jgi:hypothetical protein
MAAWLAIVKAVAPHVSTIVSAAMPVFTQRKGDTDTSQLGLAQQQIAELQEAATRNGAHIRELAAQLSTTVEALEKGAVVAEAKVRRLYLLNGIAVAVALLALAVALLALLRN